MRMYTILIALATTHRREERLRDLQWPGIKIGASRVHTHIKFLFNFLSLARPEQCSPQSGSWMLGLAKKKIRSEGTLCRCPCTRSACVDTQDTGQRALRATHLSGHGPYHIKEKVIGTYWPMSKKVWAR